MFKAEQFSSELLADYSYSDLGIGIPVSKVE